MAGFIPPPGTYVQDIKFFYSGDSSASLEIGGLTVTGGVDANVYYELPVALWVAPRKVLGGHLALSLIAPVGWKDVSAGLELTGPAGGVVGVNTDDSDVAFGDPVPGAAIGWHEGNWHWNVGVLLNVPVGYWQRGNLSNIGFNRWGVDTTAAVTWLDQQRGLEISSAAGFTFNFENPETDYRSGTEFHLEWAIMQNLSKAFGVGLVGYHYQQVSGDDGSSATLGDFKGRVTALGPNINYNFTVRQTPISTSLRYLQEFNVKNRLEGYSLLFTATVPLSVGN
jgi:hypothetical protein